MRRNIIKLLRKNKGLKKGQVSKAIGVPFWVYCYYENHIQYLSNETIKNIIKIIDFK